MTTINEISIMGMAKDVVNDFIDGKATLNDGVIKKATAEGLNTEQTKRLIERTNVDAFLRQYPNNTDFDVADPEVILGIHTNKIASATKDNNTYSKEDTGLFKAASENNNKIYTLERLTQGETPTYLKKIASISSEEIFGINDPSFIEKKATTKYEYAIDKESQQWLKNISNSVKTASELRLQENAREIKFNDALEDLASFIKQASLSGKQSIKSSEEELLNMYPNDSTFIRTLYDSITDNMKTACVKSDLLVRGDPVIDTKLACDTTLTNKFANLLNIARDYI